MKDNIFNVLSIIVFIQFVNGGMGEYDTSELVEYQEKYIVYYLTV